MYEPYPDEEIIMKEILLLLATGRFLNLFFNRHLVSNSDILLITFAFRGDIASILLDHG